MILFYLYLTLSKVAEVLGVKQATAQRYESGDIKNIKHDTIIALSKLLKCTPTYLMEWEDIKTEHYKLSTNIEKINLYK